MIGFMNWAPPSFIQEANRKALQSVEANHYSIPRGRIRLRNALSEYMSPSFKLEGGRKLDVNSEILVTAGANEGMFGMMELKWNKLVLAKLFWLGSL